MKKKKVLKILLTVLLALILLFPIPINLKDGGTVEYKALLYKVSYVKSLASREDMEKGKEYNKGTIVEVLGFEIYNSVK